MNPYASLNGLGAQNPAARLLQQPNAGGMPNGMSIQGSLPMDEMKAVWMQNQAGLVKAANAGVPNLGGMNLGGAAAQQQRMQQLPGAGLPGLQQMGNGAGGLGGMRMDNMAGMAGLNSQNQLQALQLQQLHAQAQAVQQQQQQQAAQHAQTQMAIQQHLQRQQQLQQQQQLVQQQAQAQIALRQQQQQIQQQQQLQQQLQQQQLQHQLQQQQQLASAGLQGNAGLMQSNLQSLMGGAGGQGNQFLLNQGANAAAAAQLASNQRQAELLAANGLVSNQLQQLQNAGAQGLTPAQQQLLQQQLLKQAAQQGVSQGMQFGNAQQSAVLQQQLQQASNAAQLRNLAQMNAQQDLVRRQQQAQAMQAQQQAQQQAQLLHLQRQAAQQQQQQQQQLQHLQQQQQMHAVQQAQQQSANQQAINAAAAMALRATASGAASERDQQLLRFMAAAAGKADTVGTLPAQLSTATTTAALAQRQLVAGLNAQKAAALQGLAGGMQQGGPSSNGAPNAALSQAMLSQLLQTNRPFEPNPARVGVIGQDRGKQPSTDLGAAGSGLSPGASAPMASGTNPALSSLAGAVGMGLAPLAGNSNSAGPSRQMTPPPIGSPGALGAAAAAASAAGPAGEFTAGAAAAGDAAGVAGGPGVVLLPETASPENVEKFLKAVGKRFAALGLTIEQAMEYNILTGLTKEQLAVLSAASSTPATGAEGDAAAGVEGAAGASAAAGIVLADAVGLLPAALAGVIGEGGAASGAAEAGIGGEAGGAAAAAHEDDDDADKVLESLLEPEEQVAPVGQLDEATAAAILAMTGDANFNAFTYGFFGDAGPADSMSLGGGGGGGIEDLLGELEPEGATTLDGDEAGLGGMNRPAVSDLSEIADFEPLNPAQLASWGSVDTGAGESAALAAAAHGAGAAERVGAAAVPASNVSSAAEGGAVVQEQPAGAEGEVAGDAAAAAAGQASAAAELAADLKGLSLGAGFE